MSEWYSNALSEQTHVALNTLAIRLLLSWAVGCVVAWLANRNNLGGTSNSLAFTLVLMCILIAMVTQIIGDNVARAFSLVGALSIVRFRTAVPATRDVAFVLASVVLGMAIGAGQYYVAFVGIFVLGLATFAFTCRWSDSGEGVFTDFENCGWNVTIQTGLNFTVGLETELSRLVKKFKLISMETTRRGSALEAVYCVVLKSNESISEIVASLNAIPSVESVAVKAK